MKPEAKQVYIDDLLRRRQKCLDMKVAKLPGTSGAAFGRIIERYERMLRNQGFEVEGKS